MKKTAVVYWSGTGNTKEMAEAVAQAAQADLFTSDEFLPAQMEGYEALAFGCPSMGAEELEDGSFQPLFDSLKPRLSGKRIALFGSYDWGDGEWMRTWQTDCEDLGATLVAKGLICHLTPGEEDLAACQDLGKALSQE